MIMLNEIISSFLYLSANTLTSFCCTAVQNCIHEPYGKVLPSVDGQLVGLHTSLP